jgi:hypothetical protein
MIKPAHKNEFTKVVLDFLSDNMHDMTDNNANAALQFFSCIASKKQEDRARMFDHSQHFWQFMALNSYDYAFRVMMSPEFRAAIAAKLDTPELVAFADKVFDDAAKSVDINWLMSTASDTFITDIAHAFNEYAKTGEVPETDPEYFDQGPCYRDIAR